jgi:hypothetical protein
MALGSAACTQRDRRLLAANVKKYHDDDDDGLSAYRSHRYAVMIHPQTETDVLQQKN